MLAPIFRSANGWISDDIFVWINWSYQYSENIDIRYNQRSIKLNKKLEKDSWTVITEKINCFLKVSTTGHIMAFWQSGWVYRKYSWNWVKNSNTVWSAVLSCCEFNWYIYFTTSSTLYRVALWSISDVMAFSWFQTFTNGSNYHPMTVLFNNFLFIWDKNNIASLDIFWVWDWALLSISPQVEIRYLNPYWWSVKIYSQYTYNNKSEVSFWDWITPSVNESITLEWINLEQVITKDWLDYLITNNRFWILDWYKTSTLKEISNYSTNLNSITIKWNRLLYWWVGWVYEWGSINKNYPEVLSYSYRTSNASNDTVWAIFYDWTDLYVSWSNGSTYGIDKLWTNYYTSWYLTTRVYFAETRISKKASNKILTAFNKLNANEQIKIYYRYNITWSYTLLDTITSSSTKVNDYTNWIDLVWEWNFIEFKIELVWDWTTSPEFYELDLEFKFVN
jgi:hypothetical protein